MSTVRATSALYAYDCFVMRDATTLGEFSSHMAALAALIRLHDPAFRRLDGDTCEDLKRESAFRKAIAGETTGSMV